jgi:hypothetical protein
MDSVIPVNPIIEYFESSITRQRIDFIKDFSKILSLKEIKTVYNILSQRKKYLGKSQTNENNSSVLHKLRLLSMDIEEISIFKCIEQVCAAFR